MWIYFLVPKEARQAREHEKTQAGQARGLANSIYYRIP